MKARLKHRWLVGQTLVALVGGFTVPMAAQGPSPVRDLLSSARDRLHDLRFREADSIARAVLEFPHLRRVERIQALQIAAGATYPEQESAQDRDRSIDILRALVRYAPEQALPRDVSWDGLDSLYRAVKRQTFGVSAVPREANVFVGPDGRGAIEVNASRPARFVLHAQTAVLDRVILLDSTEWVEKGVLRFGILRDGRPIVKNGPFDLVITAIDSVWGDSLQLKFAAVIDAPPRELQPVPERLDTTKLLPELTRPRRKGGIIGGLFAVAGTIAASQVIREPVFKSTVAKDGRATKLGIVVGLGAGAGVWLLDKGSPIKKNIEANQETRRQFAADVDRIKAENRKRIADYRVDVRINPEPQ